VRSSTSTTADAVSVTRLRILLHWLGPWSPLGPILSGFIVRFPLALTILFLACNPGEHPPGKSIEVDSVVTPEVRSEQLRAASPRPRVSDTTRWTDTTRRGDTAFFARGGAVTTVTVFTDSTWWKLYGVPYGLFALWDGTKLRANTQSFTQTYQNDASSTLLIRLAKAKEQGIKMWTVMTGGGRAPYLDSMKVADTRTPEPNDSVIWPTFSMAKWKAAIDAYRPHKAEIQRYIELGVFHGNTVMDEPFNTGLDPGQAHNGWGLKGTMTKARVDSMCAYVKSIWPDLPQGVVHDEDDFEPSKSYRVCDLIVSQYRVTKATVTDFRDAGLRLAKRDGHQIAFAYNHLDGGTPAPWKRPDGTKKRDYDPDDCPIPETGGRGTYFPNCRATPEQIRQVGYILGPAGCFYTGWQFREDMAAKPDYQQAFRDVAQWLKWIPQRSCRRTA
jgi:hypothetical protein